MVLVDINADGVQAVAASIGAAALPIAADVTSATEAAAAVARSLEAHGRLDIVVNNAGWTDRNQPLLEVSEAEFDKVYAINVKSIYT